MTKLTGKWLALAFACALFFGGCKKAQDAEPSGTTSSTSELVPQKGANYISNQYIIVYNGNSTPSSRVSGTQSYEQNSSMLQQSTASLLAQYGIPASAIKQTYVSGMNGFTAELTPEQVTKLKSDPNIQSIEQDQTVTLGTAPAESTTPPSSQLVPWGVAKVGYGPAIGKTAWTIDTGVDITHPDLTVDATRCMSFLGSGTTAQDQNGHGTHVAGIIGAKNNSMGVVGVAAGATIVALRALDASGSGTMSNIIAAVDWVASHAQRGDVVNMSIGGGISDALNGAVYMASLKGIFFTIAAGNAATNAATISPACVNGEYIYTIAAMDSNSMWASFSNYGAPPIDYCAPGVSITSTYLNGQYAMLTGTSMAAPHMAGLLLLDGSNVRTQGTVKGDPTGHADPIPHK